MDFTGVKAGSVIFVWSAGLSLPLRVENGDGGPGLPERAVSMNMMKVKMTTDVLGMVSIVYLVCFLDLLLANDAE